MAWMDIALAQGRCSAQGWAGVPVAGGPLRRCGLGRVAVVGAGGRLAPTTDSLQGGEVFAQGVVTVQDGGVRVGGDPVDDGVGEDLLFHPVVPLAWWQLGTVDR